MQRRRGAEPPAAHRRAERERDEHHRGSDGRIRHPRAGPWAPVAHVELRRWCAAGADPGGRASGPGEPQPRVHAAGLLRGDGDGAGASRRHGRGHRPHRGQRGGRPAVTPGGPRARTQRAGAALLLALGTFAPAGSAPGGGGPGGVCEGAGLEPGRPATDLYCIELMPTDAAPAATGTDELHPVPTPFGTAVTRDGEHVHAVRVTARGLPEPSSLGPYTAYVAWATTPVLHPVVKLGALGADGVAEGRVAFNKCLVLITAEAAPDVEERAGRLVLRGQSASMLMQPHDLPFILAAAAAGGDSAGGHAHGHAAHADAKAAGAPADGWIVPPMHPKVSMPEALMRFRPDVAPFLPSADPATLTEARPRQLIRLGDGDTLRLQAGLVRRTLRGRTLVMYGFNGQYPGPLIHVDQETSIVVEFTNRLDLPTA